MAAKTQKGNRRGSSNLLNAYWIGFELRVPLPISSIICRFSFWNIIRWYYVNPRYFLKEDGKQGIAIRSEYACSEKIKWKRSKILSLISITIGKKYKKLVYRLVALWLTLHIQVLSIDILWLIGYSSHINLTKIW